MDYRYKQLEQELSALSKVFSDLGIRLSEVAKEVASPGVMPSEKLLEQISASRTSFENCRTAIHGHAGAMLVSPLPKVGELVSITAIDSLLKASAVAEESKLSIEAERELALEILGRVLAITHRETTEFKPLQECHAKLGELRSAISNVLWPHKHPESESIVSGKHSSNALLTFVENLDNLDDEKWMVLETTITESYGKPLFVAASRGKLAIGAEAKAHVQPASKPTVAAPAPPPAKAPVAAPPEPPKPVAAAEKPVEKKAPEKPAAVPATAPAAPAAAPAAVVEKKVATPPAPVAPPAPAPAAVAPQKPAAPQAIPPSAAPAPVAAAPPTPVAVAEKKESSEKPHPVVAPAPSVPAASATPAAPAPVPAAPQVAATVVSTPAPVASATPSPAPPSAHPAPPAPSAPVASVPVPNAAAPAPPRPPAPVPVAPQAAPAPVASAPAPAAPPAATNSHAAQQPQPQSVTTNSLSALATATDTPADKRPGAPAPAESLDRQRREPRLATVPATQAVAKTEPNGEEFSAEEAEKAAAGDSSQRPQRWGFWRGNRT